MLTGRWALGTLLSLLTIVMSAAKPAAAAAAAATAAAKASPSSSRRKPPQHPTFVGKSRSVYNFERLNVIGQGTYGVVYR